MTEHIEPVKYENNDGKLQEDVIVKFTGWSARNILYNDRTKSNVHVTTSLTKRQSNLLAYAKEMVKNRYHMASKLINYIFVDRNSQLMVFTKTGRFLKFNSKLEFDLFVPFIEMDNRSNNNDIIAEDYSEPRLPVNLVYLFTSLFTQICLHRYLFYNQI